MCVNIIRRRRAHTHTHTRAASLSRRPFNPRTAAVVDHLPRRSYYSYVLLYCRYTITSRMRNPRKRYKRKKIPNDRVTHW